MAEQVSAGSSERVTDPETNVDFDDTKLLNGISQPVVMVAKTGAILP
jgi:hypothetical protein